MVKVQSASPPDHRIGQLDGLRGLAACAVGLLFHARVLYGDAPNPLAGVPVAGWFQVYGWAFVDLFFVLSGFVFAHTYLVGWQLRPGMTARQFWLARIARLWPLHLAMLAFAVLLLRAEPSTNPANVLLSALMLQVLVDNPTEVLNGPAWSLSVEMVAYGLFLLAALTRPALFKAVALAAIAWGAWDIWTHGVWGALIGRGLLGFFLGVAVQRNLELLSRLPVWLLAPVLLIPALVPPQGNALLLTVLLAWPAAILLALRSPLLASPVMLWLGDRSYAIYLIHVPVYTLLGNLALDWGITGTASWLALTIAAWALILVLSNTAYRQLERPAQRAIRALGEPARAAFA